MAIPRLSRVFGGIPVYENNHARGNAESRWTSVAEARLVSATFLGTKSRKIGGRSIVRFRGSASPRSPSRTLAIPRVRTLFERPIGAPEKRYEKSPINPAAYGTRLTALAFRPLRANRELQRPRIRTQERKKRAGRRTRRQDDDFLAGQVEGRIIMTGGRRDRRGVSRGSRTLHAACSSPSLPRPPAAPRLRRASPLPVHMLPRHAQGYIIDHNLRRVLHRYVTGTSFTSEYRRVEWDRRRGGSAHKRVSQGVS